MLDQPNKNGRSNGHSNAGLVVEDLQNLTFQVHRKVFVSPDILEDENRAIFDKCWVYVGHASEVKNPGDFRTRHVAGRPIIFCRDRKGEVRALFNVCRHRGALVCREREGNARHFSASTMAGPTTSTVRSRAFPVTTPIRRDMTNKARA